ncbi:MAG: dinitrogenase iron-molybdenum cofactor biosynthesis protein [Nitrospinae bacterium]|nr:dinitrogenase iron-molybdenum cofactor biosynthesis protein [Nitrospinota bacterium]
MRVAAASKDGRLIDQHFGHAERFLIFDADESGVNLVEERRVEKYCSGDPEHLYDPERTKNIFDALKDCSILLVSRIGTRPEKELEKCGIKVFMIYDRIEEGIKAVMSGGL